MTNICTEFDDIFSIQGFFRGELVDFSGLASLLALGFGGC